MTEIIMELSEEELPDYVNALLDQNRELREENARLKDEAHLWECRALTMFYQGDVDGMTVGELLEGVEKIRSTLTRDVEHLL